MMFQLCRMRKKSKDDRKKFFSCLVVKKGKRWRREARNVHLKNNIFVEEILHRTLAPQTEVASEDI